MTVLSSDFIHGRISFLIKTDRIPLPHVPSLLPPSSSADGHLGRFHISSSVNGTAVTTECSCLFNMLVSSSFYSIEELLGPLVAVVLTCRGISLLSLWLCNPLPHPPRASIPLSLYPQPVKLHVVPLLEGSQETKLTLNPLCSSALDLNFWSPCLYLTNVGIVGIHPT